MKGKTRRQSGSSTVSSQVLGLWPIKALVIIDWGLLRKQGTWNVTGSQLGAKTRTGREQETTLGDSDKTERPPASCPKACPPGLTNFLISLSSLATFSSFPCAYKKIVSCHLSTSLSRSFTSRAL